MNKMKSQALRPKRMVNMTRFKMSDYLQIALISIAFFALYSHTAINLVRDWSGNPNFSHGFLVPFITGFMIWQKKHLLPLDNISPSFFGLPVIVLGMAMHVAGNVGAELFVMRASLVVTLIGLSLYLLGGRFTKEIYVPILYLIIMIPIPAILWNKLAFPLQGFAARLTADVVATIGIPIFREGNVLHLANTSLEVVDACSGIRSLTSLLALSGAFSYISNLTVGGKWLLFLSAVPIAVAVNIIRLTATAVMARYIGPEAAQGFLHDMSGIVVFVAAFMMVYGVFLVTTAAERKILNR